MIEGLFQPMHLIIIAGIALLIFGPRKLPELGKGLGDGIRGFKLALKPDGETPNDVPLETTKPGVVHEVERTPKG
jgi:sec-independent protein translocase protein TatA